MYDKDDLFMLVILSAVISKTVNIRQSEVITHLNLFFPWTSELSLVFSFSCWLSFFLPVSIEE